MYLITFHRCGWTHQSLTGLLTSGWQISDRQLQQRVEISEELVHELCCVWQVHSEEYKTWDGVDNHRVDRPWSAASHRGTLFLCAPSSFFSHPEETQSLSPPRATVCRGLLLTAITLRTASAHHIRWGCPAQPPPRECLVRPRDPEPAGCFWSPREEGACPRHKGFGWVELKKICQIQYHLLYRGVYEQAGYTVFLKSFNLSTHFLLTDASSCSRSIVVFKWWWSPSSSNLMSFLRLCLGGTHLESPL